MNSEYPVLSYPSRESQEGASEAVRAVGMGSDRGGIAASCCHYYEVVGIPNELLRIPKEFVWINMISQGYYELIRIIKNYKN